MMQLLRALGQHNGFTFQKDKVMKIENIKLTNKEEVSKNIDLKTLPYLN